MGTPTNRRPRRTATPRASRARLAVTLSAVLITAGCANVPHKGPKTGTGLPPHLDASGGQLLRYCQRIRETGDLATAAGICERAHRMDPSSPAPLMEVASILTEMGELDLAVSAYKTLLHHSPDHADGHYALGRTYVAQKQYDLALAEFRWVLQGRPDDAALYNAVGVASDLIGAHGAAQEAFKKGLNRAPRDARLRNNLGLSLVRSGRYDEGVAMLASLVEEPQATQSTMENLQLALGLAAEARIDAIARAADAEAIADAGADADDHADKLAAAAPQKPAAPLQDSRPETKSETPAVVTAPVASEAKVSAVDTASPTPLTGAFNAEPATVYQALDAGEKGYEFYAAMPGAAEGAEDGKKREGRTAVAAVGRQTAKVGETDTPSGDDAEHSSGSRAAPAQESTGTREPAEAGSHAIQFASYTKAEDARHGWETLRAAVPDLLADIETEVASADLGPAKGGVFYRLRTRPTSHAKARQLCSDLSARGIDCLVVGAAPDAA